MTDYYEILGVNRNSSDDEIKKAYKKMASKHHPDKGGDTAKFQEIQKAYETLSDSGKRQEYDNPNPFNGAQFSNGTQFEFNFGNGGNDFFSQFFTHQFGGNPFQQAQPRRNKDLRVTISVPLASTLADKTTTVSIQTTKGDKFNIDITVPKGAADGTTIKYAGMGDNFFDTLTRGDLYVIVTVVPDPKYQIHGSNLVTDVEIDSIEAMVGVDKEVVGLDGKIFSIKVPAGCQYGTKFGLAGQGLYVLNSNYRGDLIANITIKTLKLSEDQIDQLKNFWYS